METILKDKIYTEQEYFKLEEGNDLRHEFINGQLFEMLGASTEHYLMVKRIERLLESLFEPLGFLIYRENMKVKITGKDKYYYPDVFMTREANTQANRYCKHEPELIVEVSSESTFRIDAVDKLIAYQKIPFLKYYLIADPEKTQVIVYTKDNEGGWLSEALAAKTDQLILKKWDLSLPLQVIYP
ncbi:MAG: Uma2 family endonuclease [Chitinophagaceae bacterium]